MRIGSQSFDIAHGRKKFKRLVLLYFINAWHKEEGNLQLIKSSGLCLKYGQASDLFDGVH